MAEEEEVVPCFQATIITHFVGIVIHEEILSLQHCFGVQYIMQHKPEEHFMFLLTIAFPHPFESWGSTSRIHEGFIYRGNLESTSFSKKIVQESTF
jgi:hypothetical protein